VAAGVRRIEAVAGDVALAYTQRLEGELARIAEAVKAPVGDVATRIAQLQDQVKALERELAALKSKLAAAASGDLASRAVERDGIRFLAARVADGTDAKAL
ncbi:MAG: alanine--tRNA ligase, partial [Saprospiraceae bacterium]|nr:alanine--tRNA ligase [Saprospiraceae bacterium]